MRKGEVAYVRRPVAEPGPGQLLVQAARTLISTGTELTCLSGRYEPGSHWDGWVKYPFRPGYCMAGTVLAAGEGATTFKGGARGGPPCAHPKRVHGAPRATSCAAAQATHHDA